MKTLLKNCSIVDGSKNAIYKGNILIKDNIIEEISCHEINSFQDGRIIDCQGKYVSPGFIDTHSHNDFFAPYDDPQRFFEPFIHQGITTYIGGNCGHGIAGFPKDVDYRNDVEHMIMNWTGDLLWYSYDDFFEYMKHRSCLNMALLVGHCSLRAAVCGGATVHPPAEKIEYMMKLIDKGMEEGAVGTSLGLMYEPGLFADTNEIIEVAKCVAKHNKILAVHARSYSSVSTNYPMKPFGTPHNLRAVNDILDVSSETGAKLQFSHQIFVGRKTFSTVDKFITTIDQSHERGIDMRFDLFSTECGVSIITVLLPKWYKEIPRSQRMLPHILRRLWIECEIAMRTVGFGYDDILLCWSDLPGLEEYIGLTVDIIAKKMGLSPFKAYIEILKRSDYSARINMFQYSNSEIIGRLSKHPLSIFSTDAWVEDHGVQNPALISGMTRFILRAKEGKGPSLEETIHKMTGAPAERFGLKKRGLIKKGYIADITVFDFNNMKEETLTDCVTHVFLNGHLVMENQSVRNLQGLGEVIRG